ncbi:MAG: DUF4783 domain-containing protein [Bacteroidia bacterium]|nr:DUF4783 domain-containing protein [Bacteroidia bacterium]
MKTIKNILITLVAFSTFAFTSLGNTEELITGFKTGNAALIANQINGNASISLNGINNMYSKAQAELVLKDFFEKNSVKSFTILHQGESKDGAQYLMGSLVNVNGTHRVYAYFKKVGDQTFIKELRIE